MSTDRPDPENLATADQGGAEPGLQSGRASASERTAELTTGFERRFAQWGRPPATTFRVGPLPKDNSFARLDEAGPRMRPLEQARPAPTPGPTTWPEPRPAARPLTAPMPSPASGSGFFNGSMIPRAAPAATPATTLAGDVAGTAPTPTNAPVIAPPPMAEGPVEPAAIDTTVRPLPPAPGVAARDSQVDPSQVASIPQTPASVVTPTPVVEARPLPDSDISEESPAAFTPRVVTRRPSRAPLYLGGAAVVVLAGGALAWFLTQKGAEPTPTVANPLVALAPQPVEATPVEATPVEATPVEAAPAAVTPTTSVPAATAVARTPLTSTPAPTPARTAPTVAPTTRPAAAAPRPTASSSAATTARSQLNSAPASASVAPPVIVVRPLETAPAPTAARPSQTDPDAPVVTRPQPLD